MAETIHDYLSGLPDDRKEALTRLCDTIRARIPDGYAEGIQYGMPSWFVPHSRFAEGYHCDPKQPVPFLGVASQKAHVGLYAFFLYVDPDVQARFVDAYQKTGKKLDMGKGCVRFKKVADIPYELIGDTVANIPVDRFLAVYEASVPPGARKKPARTGA